MGHVGLKPWVYRFLSERYPQAFTPEETGDEAIRAGIPSQATNPRQSFSTTIRRWARPGDQYQDPRFGQRYEGGRILILAYPPGYSKVDAPEIASGGTLRDQRLPRKISCSGSEDKLDSDCLADLLVDHGEFPHRVDALKAIAELSLRGVLIPQRLRKDLESAIEQEREARQMMRMLISEVRSLLDTTNP